MQTQANQIENKDYYEVAPGVWGMKIIFVNIYMVAAGDGKWVLVDTGLKGFKGRIKSMAADLFGANTPPAAIILTHGHFDHVGTLKDLLKDWNVPVYAHTLELPYLTGKSSYPPADPFVGGGIMPLLSVVYPTKPIDVSEHVQALDKSGAVPVLTEWNYIHTPGHAPGHVSLYRHRDGLLIVGDAFVTTKQESAFDIATQKKEVTGPPKYFTPDWESSAASVKALWQLHPKIAAAGHGQPMYGEELSRGLDELVKHFDEVAIPAKGRYVNEPVKANKRGIQYVPPAPAHPVLIASVAALAGLLAYTIIKKVKK